MKFSLCSNCFQDEGLMLTARKVGIDSKQKCPNCQSVDGKKLTKDRLYHLSYLFFVRGSICRLDFGGTPTIQFNEYHHKKTEIEVTHFLQKDIALIETKIKIGFFYYGPRLWMVGEVEPLKDLQKVSKRNKILNKIVKEYPTKVLDINTPFYRLRANPQHPSAIDEYDTPPEQFVGNGRLDSKKLPVLYASQDLEICIHECRSTIDDDLYVAKLVSNQPLRLLDLTELLDEKATEFESLDMAIHMLFLGGKHSYPISKEIAVKAYKKGYDGIIYPSYFSLIRTGAVPFDTVYGLSIRILEQFKQAAKAQIIQNIALFNRPILDNKLRVECINKVILNKVIYDISFGPTDQRIFE